MTRLCMELSASSDTFNHRVGTIMDNFPNLNLARKIDNLLVFAAGMTELDEQLRIAPVNLPRTSLDSQSAQVPAFR